VDSENDIDVNDDNNLGDRSSHVSLKGRHTIELFKDKLYVYI